MLFQDDKFDLAQILNYFRVKPDGDLVIYYEMEPGEECTTRGIVEVNPTNNR